MFKDPYGKMFRLGGRHHQCFTGSVQRLQQLRNTRVGNILQPARGGVPLAEILGSLQRLFPVIAEMLLKGGDQGRTDEPVQGTLVFDCNTVMLQREGKAASNAFGRVGQRTVQIKQNELPLHISRRILPRSVHKRQRDQQRQ